MTRVHYYIRSSYNVHVVMGRDYSVYVSRDGVIVFSSTSAKEALDYLWNNVHPGDTYEIEIMCRGHKDA